MCGVIVTHLTIECERYNLKNFMLIYLADLGHNQLTRSSDVYPLGVANLAAWLMRDEASAASVRIEIFREPEDLSKALLREAPSILGLSNYAWNNSLSMAFARHARELTPDTIICMGGPNWPQDVSSQDSRVRAAQGVVDVFVVGLPYEGERAFEAFVERCFETHCDRQALLSQPIIGCVHLSADCQTLHRGAAPEMIADLDEIPSPYRLGLLDGFFDTGYFPLMQIARGCPFSCAFCNSGVTDNSRIRAHSSEEVRLDLDYISERVTGDATLCLADDNFGMYRRDEVIADQMAALRKKTGWPAYIRTTTGKNNTDRILRVLHKVGGTLPMTAAVQSMNEVVLKNIKRSNIRLETYTEIQKELAAMGMQSYGELILCLPGETAQSFLAAVETFLDAGAERVSAHQLMLLDGAELSTPESRERFGFETRFRLVARNIGRYVGQEVAEVEEMVVATPDFSLDDYYHCRLFHLLLTITFYEGNFQEVFRLAAQGGVKPYRFVQVLQDRLPQASAPFRELVDAFLEESAEELFPTREACLKWAADNFDGLLDGTKGGNLLSKYSMMGRFFHLDATLEFLGDTLRSVVDTVRVGSSEIDAVMSYMRAILLTTPFGETTRLEPEFCCAYDVEAWFASDENESLGIHVLSTPLTFKATTPEETRELILGKVSAFGEHASGLGKFTRTMFARDLRRQLRPIGDARA